MAGTVNKKKAASTEPIQAPRGTYDVLPQDQKYWEYVTETAKNVVRGFGFHRIDTPVFEETDLFRRSIGEATDVVNKEMFEIKGRGGVAYALRPEGTAAVARSFIEHGMRSWPKPVKLFYLGPFFRYERPQAGRWRQHQQLGVEIYGSSSHISDAQVIYVMKCVLDDLGLEDYRLKVNSIGEAEERKEYLKQLKEYYRHNRSKLCRVCKERLKTNPLRLLDCKEEKCSALAGQAPRLLDYLSDSSRQYFENVLKSLDALGINYEIVPSLVRGLDYYTHTVFEFVAVQREEKAQNAIASGGRYNGLVKQLGGKETAAVGGAIGLERVIDQIKNEGIELTVTDNPNIFVAHLGEQSKRQALKVLRDLQIAGIPFAESLDRDGMQAQLKAADRIGASWAVIIGHKEVIDKTVILRNMESGMQEVVPQERMVTEIKRRLNMPLDD